MMGVAEEEIEAMEAAEADNSLIEIWPENLDSLRLFLGVMTQWRRDTSSGLPTGLDYAGVQAGLKMMRRHVSKRAFEDLQVLESAYVAETRKVAKADQDRQAEIARMGGAR
ncbi:MAG: DUF1799 domain-containing protein [Rhodospirillaceae bacterium]|nr:DUF1799 domain-containing protein [Rhodospirillaceae bacterium]